MFIFSVMFDNIKGAFSGEWGAQGEQWVPQ
jgi:hypothetical protein